MVLWDMLLAAMDVTKSSKVCSLAGMGNRRVSEQKLVNLRHPVEYVALVDDAMPRLRKNWAWFSNFFR